jgi:putative Holliday junction resolvase
VAFQDERLSTFEAEERLRERGVSTRDQRGLIDAEAAAVILQSYLDATAAPAEPEDPDGPDQAAGQANTDRSTP